MADIIKPIVRLIFPCDEAKLDSKDNKWVLKNPWHTVAMPAGVTENFYQQEMWLYAQLTGGVGDFYLSVHLLNEAGLVVGKSEPTLRELTGGDRVFEEVFYMTQVPFAEPGLFEIKLMGNHAELDGGTFYLRVLSGS